VTRARDELPADYRARDYESLLAAMHAMVPSKLPEWRDHANEADFGNVLLQLFAHLGDILGYYQDRVADESLLGTARSRRSVIDHLRLIGYQFSTAAPAAALLVVSVAADVTDTVVVAPGDAFATTSGKDRPSVRFEYTGESPLTIDFAGIAVDPASRRKVFGDPRTGEGIGVEEGRRFADELVGLGDGTPDQRHPLLHSPVIRRPPGGNRQTSRDVQLVTRENGVDRPWLLVDTLALSVAEDRHFALQIDAADQATLVFGDGVLGAVPPADAEIRVTYRTGGGRRGNVPAGAITTIVDAPPLALLGARVLNPAASTGGDDRETIEHAVAHAPSVFRSLGRAVTAADYEALALSFKGVGKVRALSTGWNTVTLLVAPAGGGKVSDVLQLGLKAFFEDKRMLSQVVEVEDVDYVPIRITAEIAVESYYVPEEVIAAVRQAAADLVSFDAVSFGQPVYLSAFYEKAQEVPGVVFVNITEFRRDDVATPPVEPTGRILLAPNELPVLEPDGAHPDGVLVVPAGADPGPRNGG
jgi:hypothetical protein